MSASFSVQAEPTAGAHPTLTLHAPYPNPARGPVQITYETPLAGAAVLEVLDPLGRRVAVLASGEHAAGRHELTWDPAALPNGTYVLRFHAGGETARQRLTRLR